MHVLITYLTYYLFLFISVLCSSHARLPVHLQLVSIGRLAKCLPSWDIKGKGVFVCVCVRVCVCVCMRVHKHGTESTFMSKSIHHSPTFLSPSLLSTVLRRYPLSIRGQRERNQDVTMGAGSLRKAQFFH